jgi:hypothetical protein
MLLSHLSLELGHSLHRIHIGSYGFVESAQTFIFLSGLLIGLLFIRRIERDGFAAVRARLNRRALQLYIAHLALVLGAFAAAGLFSQSWWAWNGLLGRFYADPQGYAVAAAALLYQPAFLDILPQYILYLLVAPFVLLAIARDRLWLVLACILLSWLAVQLGAHIPVVKLVDAQLSWGGQPVEIRGHFNPLAWQLLFMGGVVIGALVARGELDPGRIFRPDQTALLKIALLVLIFFLGWRLTFQYIIVDHDLLAQFRAHERRGEFGLVFLVNFLAFAYVVSWLLVAGRQRAPGLARQVGDFLHAIFAHPWMTLLGRHALVVYCWHVVLVYAVSLADTYWGPAREPWSSIIGLIMIAALWLPALVNERVLPALVAPRAVAR